ncbi:multidrug effflux MFS transporter [Arthrobacter gengyunqii]|uniref:Multidrug effflux MFS transporter n=1 Tax=Arthrobacter gengyunqii TaxID=2886940 RepID=A0A9X1S638_9MICC|nr:multidrug effflux MFS transporter [Arthrobacter gengyunqii]MCC3268661.1 multidrug effflux MFS transporter [Arthrobacter gengyunqii]UOY96048.1 multidrug effflux MFS transporter [Arthrobacter gengyunqii]
MFSPFRRKPVTAMTTGLLLVLALLSATGPFATDLYLPSFPAMTDELKASATAVQLTLTAFLLGMGTGQLVFGPLSDRYGRFRPLLLGSAGFVVASAACALAPNLAVLVAARLVQGLCASAGVVIARAMVADLTTGATSARTFSLLMTIGGVAPVVAPTVGGLLAEHLGWRGVLWVLAGLALLMFVCVAGVLAESQPRSHRSSGPVLAGLKGVVASRKFLGYAVLFASTFGVLMAYISASPFVYQNLMGITASAYGLAFGLNAMGLVGAGFISARLARRIPPRKTVTVAVSVLLTMSVAVLVLSVSAAPPQLLAVPIFFAASSVGFIMGNTTSLALAEVGLAAGSGSAVLGAGQFFAGALVSPLTGLAGKESAVPLAIIMTLSALLAVAALVATRTRSAPGR